MKPECPTCGLVLDRGEEGYQVGAYFFNIVASELIFVAVFMGVVVTTWPTPPWSFLQYAGPVMAALSPVILFPFSKTLYLAFDLLFRPERKGAKL